MGNYASAGARSRWAVVLAGGDGRRLLPLTRRISGDDRPKQFCRLLGSETLLERTLRRVARVVNPKRTLSVVTKAHEGFYSGLPLGALLVQPCNRGTTAAIVYSLTQLWRSDPDGVVGFFPSDHHFTRDDAFAACAKRGFRFAELHPEAVVLLGIPPDHPETGYGWIEPGTPAPSVERDPVFRVRGFWEKPSREAAVDLMRRGCLWNSFVMFGRLAAFLELIRLADPDLLSAFQAIAPALSTKHQEASVLQLYRSISPGSFTQGVLSVSSTKLAVMRSETLGWADVGEVDRALSLIRAEGGILPRAAGSSEAETAHAAAATA